MVYLLDLLYSWLHMQICQVSKLNTTQTSAVNLGILSSAVWTMVRKDPLILNVAYSGGDGGR